MTPEQLNPDVAQAKFHTNDIDEDEENEEDEEPKEGDEDEDEPEEGYSE